MFRLFSKKKESPAPYDPEKEKPVIRASICTREKAAGFKDRNTGTFREIMLIRDQKDLERFLKTYGLDHVDTEY